MIDYDSLKHQSIKKSAVNPYIPGQSSLDKYFVGSDKLNVSDVIRVLIKKGKVTENGEYNNKVNNNKSYGKYSTNIITAKRGVRMD